MTRILELDALRGIAATAIVMIHLGWIADTRWTLSLVDFFFVISGYLITSNVLKHRRSPGFLGVFFTRRALRIWPAYYVALAACLVVNRSLTWDMPPDAWPYYLTFTQNVHAYFGRPSPRFSGMFLHTWTLAIEEQFYLLWPVLLYRTGRRGTLAVIATAAAVPPVMRMLGYSPYLLLTRCDGLAFGSLLAVVLTDRDRVARNLSAYRRAFAAVGLSALVAPALVSPALGTVGTGEGADRIASALFTTRAVLVDFGLVGLTLCLQGKPWLKPLRDRRLCYVGTVSYGLYLYHPLVFAALPGPYKRLVVRKLGLPVLPILNVVMIAVCFLLAEVSRRSLEGPVLAFKDRIRFKPDDGGRPYRGPHARPSATSEPSTSTVGAAFPRARGDLD